MTVEVQDQIMAGLSKSEREQLLASLERVKANLVAAHRPCAQQRCAQRQIQTTPLIRPQRSGRNLRCPRSEKSPPTVALPPVAGLPATRGNA